MVPLLSERLRLSKDASIAVRLAFVTRNKIAENPDDTG